MRRSGGIARAPNERETLDHARGVDNGAIELGTVGWDDRDEHFDLGTEDNDGHTIVFVTLFRGRDIASSDQTPDAAQGHKVTARMGKPARAVPEKGSTVLVARPAGIDGPGAWHIISNPGPGTTFRNGPKAGDVLFEGDAGNFVRFAKNGSISLVTTVDGTSESPTIYEQIRRDGYRFVGPWGKVTFDAAGYHLKHHTGARIDLGGIGGMPSPLDELGSYVNLTADIVKLAGRVVSLGPDAGVQDNVPLYTPLLAILGEVSAALSGIASALGAVGTQVAAITALADPTHTTSTTAAAMAGAITAAATACTTATGGITAAPTLLPSQAVTVV